MFIFIFSQWKAAKEELKQDEDEPKNAVEILERKRQREIEVCISCLELISAFVHSGALWFFACRNGMLSKLPVERPKIMLIFSL